jgi:hypothetical protein
MLLMLLLASPAEPGLRSAHPRGKPAAYEPPTRKTRRLQQDVRRGPNANERGAVRGMHRRTPRSRFSWDALNVTNTTACGWTKCYFPTQLGERKNKGWLVGRPQCAKFGCPGPRDQLPELSLPSRWFPQWNRTWTFAEELRADFGVDHLLRRPPFIATLPQETAAYLNSKLKGLHRDRKPHWVHRRIKGAAQWYSAGPHPVQAVRSCSWPECILLGCEGSLKAKMYAKRVEGFIANAPNKTKLGEGIKKNVALVAAMVKAHPCLKIDFQVYLRNDGAVLNIDLDRCDKLELGISLESQPLDKGHNLRLARVPGFCQRGRDGKGTDQLRLDKALEQLYELRE